MGVTYYAEFGVSTTFRLGCRWGWAELGGIILNCEESCTFIHSCVVLFVSTPVPLFDFEMTDRHVPESQPASFTVHTMASLDACLEEEAEEESRIGPIRDITDAFATDLFAQLKLSDNFRPNDSLNSSSSGRTTRSVGRGTMLKKPAHL